ENIDDPAALFVRADEIFYLKRGLTKELRAALALVRQELPLDRADSRLGDVAVLGRKLSRLFGGVDQHRLEVWQVEQQQTFIVGMAEHDVQHAFLRFVQVQQASEKQRPHFRNSGADGVALLAIQIPEYRRIIGIGVVLYADFLRP